MSAELWKVAKAIGDILLGIGQTESAFRIEKRLRILGVDLEHRYKSPFVQLAELVNKQVGISMDISIDASDVTSYNLRIGEPHSFISKVSFRLEGKLANIQETWENNYAEVGASCR